MSNPQKVHTFTDGGNQKHWLGFSPDSSLLVTVGDRQIHRFSTEDARSFGSVSAPTTVRGLSFSPEGNVVVSGGDDGRLFFWDATSWQRTEALSSESLPIWSVAYSPDGDHLAIGTDGGREGRHAILDADSPLVLWNTTSQSAEKTAAGHTARITSVAWSPDGEYIASGSADASVRVWTKNLSPVNTLDSLARVSQVAFSPDGEYLAAGTGKDNAIRVWSTRTWELVTTIKGHSRPVTSIAFDPRSGELWSASEDSLIKTWNIERHRRNSVSTLGDAALRTMLTGSSEFVVARDGRTLFCAADDMPIQRYDLESRTALPPWSGGDSFRQTEFTDDGAALIAVDAKGLLQVWRTDSEESIAEMQMPVKDVSSLHEIAVSPDASVVAWTAGSPLHVSGSRHQDRGSS